MPPFDPPTESPRASLRLWLRRLFPFYCALVAALTFGYALFDPFQIDGDAVAYMDLGDLMRAHVWPGIVNGYWHPLYPAFLSLGHILFHSNRANELHAYYLVNFAIFLLQMVAVTAFTDSLLRLREAWPATVRPRFDFLLDRYAMRYLGLALLVIASQRELSLGKVRPDALLQALLLFGLAAMLHYLASGRLRCAVFMGLAFGLAYLTKSFAFVFALLCIATMIGFRWIWQRERPLRAALAGALAFVCFAAVAGPYVAALSRQKGRFDFGDSGSLNYAWYVGGTEKMHLEPYMTSQFGSAEVHLKHPEKELLHSPGIYSYAQLPYGTLPVWFDATFFNDQIKPHTSLRGELHRGARNVVLVFRYILNHPESLVLMALLIFFGARFALPWRPRSHAFWLPPFLLGLAIWVIYGTVNVEERYVTVGYLVMLFSLFAALHARGLELPDTRRPPGPLDPATLLQVSSAVLLLFALLAPVESLRRIAELRRSQSVAKLPAGWYDPESTEAASGLAALGVAPGDTVACIGVHACLYDVYWMRRAGVRVLTEIYDPETPVEAFLSALPNRDQAIDVVRHQGGKVLVGWFDEARMTGATPATAGWRQLGDSHLYALPLNLPAAPAPAR